MTPLELEILAIDDPAAYFLELRRMRARAAARKQVQEDPERHAEFTRRTFWRNKLQAIEILGGSCFRCGEIDPIVLTVNHIGGRNGDKRKGGALYRAVIRGEVEDCNVLCCNCQRYWEYERGVLTLPSGGEFDSLRAKLRIQDLRGMREGESVEG